jgi:hypothetical protein
VSTVSVSPESTVITGAVVRFGSQPHEIVSGPDAR